MRGRNPKGPNLTPEQEREYELFEASLARARIYELGVAAALNRAEYYNNSNEVLEASKILKEAVDITRLAQEGRSKIRAVAGDPPKPKKRSRVPVKKRA